MLVWKIRQTTSLNIERISIENALKHFSIDPSCNVDYYLKNKHEIELDLNRTNINIDVNNRFAIETLEKELF